MRKVMLAARHCAQKAERKLMKVKELFEKIENANVIASEIDGKKFYIVVDLISLKDDKHDYITIVNVNSVFRHYHKFYNYHDFATSLIHDDYSAEAVALVGYGKLANHGNGIYTLANKACYGFAFRFLTYRD